MAAGRHGDDAVRITTAAVSPQEDLRRRQRRYLISMMLRSVCFVGACFAGMAGIGWLWPALVVAAIVLPYVAVVLANVQAPRQGGLDLRETSYRAGELTGPAERDSLRGSHGGSAG